MALKETAIVEGNLVRINERSITRKSDGQVFTFRSALVIGEDSLVEARVSDDVLPDLPVPGSLIRARISLGSYRDEVETELVEVLDAA